MLYREYCSEKKCCIENIVILRKYIFLYIFQILFVHCLKYENNKKPDKRKLQKFRKPFLFIVPRTIFQTFPEKKKYILFSGKSLKNK